MKRAILAATASCALLSAVTTALAADLPTRKGPPAAPPIAYALPYNWTGFFVGANVGYGWANQSQYLNGATTLVDPIGTSYGTNSGGILGGLDLGYNYQIGQVVVGVEGDFDWTDWKNSVAVNSSFFPGLATTNRTMSTDWYGTATGRLGYAIDNVLLYGKGGLAWANQSIGGNVSGIGAGSFGSASDTRMGWTLGAGVEYGITRNITTFAEYDYLNFGSKSYTFTDPASLATASYKAKTDANVFKVGVNYKF